jgi:hypothetical protein
MMWIVLLLYITGSVSSCLVLKLCSIINKEPIVYANLIGAIALWPILTWARLVMYLVYLYKRI